MMNTLIDPFGRQHTYLRISVTDRCNLQCLYCAPSSEFIHCQRDEILTFDEIVHLGNIFARMGITKIRVTGGEPLMRRELPTLVERLSNITGIQTLGMTTNGVYLQRFIVNLKNAGLTHLNISLDTLQRERFLQITHSDQFENVLRGIDAALIAGFAPLKINVVIMEGVNDDELLDFVEFAKDKPLNIRFIEYMPFFKLGNYNDLFIPWMAMKKIIKQQYQLIPITSTEQMSTVAKDFYIEGFRGSVSFITPMSEHFCSNCNRIRLTANGSIKPCLFYPNETNVRSSLRDGSPDEKIIAIIQSVLFHKRYEHSLASGEDILKSHTMISIGG